MPAVRFQVERTFDLPQRAGILLAGIVLQGEIKGGMTLQNAATGQPVRVLGVEFLTPASQRLNRTTVLIDRRDATGITSGTELTTAE